MKKMLTMLAVAAALCVSATSLFAQAQDNGGGNGGGNGGRRFRGGGDPAQFQQQMMDTIKDRLGVTNDTDWSALQPLVQKVMDARRDAAPNMRALFGGRRGGNGGGDNGGGAGGGGNNPFNRPANPDAEALQQALEANAPSAQVNTLLEKYRASQKQKQAALTTAQSNLQKVLTPKQEAEAVLLGLLN